MERANQFLKGTGRTVGVPDLRPGNSLELDGLGPRFNGRYQIEKVTHSLGGSGYTTEFEVGRANQGDVKAARR
jgi:phage protein D